MVRSIHNIVTVFLVTAGVSLLSCNSYNKLLKSDNLKLKAEKAKYYYNKQDFVKALPLFEELVSVHKGTNEVEEIYYHYAYCFYGQGEYLMASYHFKNFVTTFPKSKFSEECHYMYAYCYYLQSPYYTLDQSETQKAINAFQLFINTYPNSERVKDCNVSIDKLRRKLEMKAYIGAELYYKTGDYKAATIALKNLLKDYPDTEDREKAYFLILKSHYLLAKESISAKKEERLNATLTAYLDFVDKFSSSTYLKDAEKIYETSLESLKKIKNNEQPKN